MGGTAAAGGGGRVAGVCSWRRRAACRGRDAGTRSTGSARTGAPVRGASWVSALGSCRRQEPPADLPPYLPADSPVGCGFLRAQRSWEDVPGSLGALGPWSAAPGSGKGLRPRCSPAAVLPGRIRALPTPTVPPGALRAAGGSRLQVWGPAGGGAFPKGREGPEPVRGPGKGPGLGRPDIFRGRGRGHHPHTR